MNEVWRALTLTLIAQAALTGAQYTVPVLAPAAARDLGISATLVGVYTGLIYIGAMVGALLAGGLVARRGPLRVTQWSLLGLGFALALFTVPVLAVVVMSALVMGLAYGPATPASTEILVVRTPQHLRNFVFSLKQSGVPLGGAAAGLVVPPLVLTFGWREAAFILAGVLALLAFALQPARSAYDRLPATGGGERARGLRTNLVDPMRLVLGRGDLRALAVLSFVFAGMQLSLASFLVVYLAEERGYSLTRAGLALAAAQISGVFARPLWGWMADRLVSPAVVLMGLSVLMGAGSAATAALDGSWPFAAVVATMVAFGTGALSWTGVYLAEVAHLAPKGQAGRATGGALFVTFAGAVVGPPLFGAITALSGSYAWGFAVFAAAALGVGAAFLGLGRTRLF